MESRSSTVRRRAWINSSRHWLTLEEPNPEGPLRDLASVSIADDDDVFSEGKIESWLLSCGLEDCPERSGHLGVESMLKANSSFDDLGLGADASALKFGEITSEAGFLLPPPLKQQHGGLTTSTPRQELRLPALNMGHSMSSSCFSSSTGKTTSSVSEVLRLCAEDAEETLYELGFGCDELQVTARIPPRFLTFPSLAQGINFRLFLESQLRRIRQEDPNLSLASRFRQVQVLTAMANAFYSLYSHVSRTPLQKLSPPEFSFSSSPIEKIGRFRSSVRSEPRSPVERLKDTVSKMCLYTGSPHGSDSTSPQSSPKKRQSVPDVVGIVLDKVKTGPSKKLYVEEGNRTDACMGQTKGMTHVDVSQRVACSKQTDKVDTSENKPTDLDNRTQRERTSLASLSEETVNETDCPPDKTDRRQPELRLGLAQRLDCDARTADLTSKVMCDVICPQIVESIHKVPFCPQAKDAKPNALPCIPTKTKSSDTSRPGSEGSLKQYQTQTATSDDAWPSIPYRITVTGWEEGGDVASTNTPDSSHATPAWTRKESLCQGKSLYLKTLGHVSKNLQQVNSFELEEVHSAGEDDFGQCETTTTQTLSPVDQHKGLVVRGDSMQSDSSGYADEEFGPSSDRHGR